MMVLVLAKLRSSLCESFNCFIFVGLVQERKEGLSYLLVELLTISCYWLAFCQLRVTSVELQVAQFSPPPGEKTKE